MSISLIYKNRSIMHYQRNDSSKNCSIYGIDQTTSYLKKQIGQIIKSQLKAYHLKNKLQLQLQEYNKQQENKKLERKMVQDRIHDFREKQNNFRKKQFELFQKKQKERQQKLKKFIANKEEVHDIKCLEINEGIQNVLEKYTKLTNDDAKMRLSKLHTSQYKRTTRSSNQSSRALSISQSSPRINFIKFAEEEHEKLKITNYLNKLQRSQSRIMLKEIQNVKRRQVSLKKKVKCFVGQRNKQDQDRMQAVQKEYMQRMTIFDKNHSKITEARQFNLISKIAINSKLRQTISQKRDQIHNYQINRVMTNFRSKKRDNIMEKYRSTMDLKYTQNNRSVNLMKKQSQDNSSELENHMRILVQKIKKLKNIKYGEVLDKVSIKILLQMFDKNDPQYNNILEFLKSQRKSYIEAIVRRQQQKNKLKKGNTKNANKTLHQ